MCERARIRRSAAKNVLGRSALGLGFGEVGGEIGRHLVRDCAFECLATQATGFA
jgi:hypothetical protein